MTESKKINVGIYVRVSTEEQAKEGYSIKGQIEKLTNYALAKDWTIHDIYDDAGKSGKNITERPAINRMIKDIKAGKIDVVLIFKIDRLTRSTRDLTELIDLFKKYKCEFSSLTKSIDTLTASGRMFLKIIGIFAEFERENLVERLKLGFERKAKEGYSNSSQLISYGYNRDKGQKILEINEIESKVVQYIFDLYTEDLKNENEIAKILNEKNIKTKTGKEWSRIGVRHILINSTYTGKIRYCIDDSERYQEFNGLHKAIIETEQFEKAQDLVSKKRKYSKTKKTKEKSYFNGALVCGLCGGKLSTHHIQKTNKNGEIKDIVSYRCINKLHYNNCTAKSMSHKKIEQAFLEYIESIEDLDINNDILESQTSPKDETEQVKINTELERLYNKKQKIMKLYLSENISFPEYKSMTEIIEQEETEIKALLGMAEEETPKDIETVLYNEDVISDIKENWVLLTDREKQEFLQRFVESMIIVNEPQANSVQGSVKILSLNFYNQ